MLCSHDLKCSRLTASNGSLAGVYVNNLRTYIELSPLKKSLSSAKQVFTLPNAGQRDQRHS